MNTPKDGGPAFPQSSTYYPNGEIEYGTPGMSLRAYIAAGLMGHYTLRAVSPGTRARWACEGADALIAELNKEKE